MRLIATLATSLLVFFASSAPAEGPREQLCKLLPEGNVCSKSMPNIFGEPPPKSVAKTDSTLTITVKDGTQRTWRNSGEEAAPHYSLAGYLTEHAYFWVFGMHYESQSDELISYETGKNFNFDNEPLYVSPDGMHILTEKRHHGSNPSSLGIYSIDRYGLTEVRRFPVEALRHCGVLWINQSEIAIFSCRFDPKTTGTYASAPVVARIKRQNNNWTFSEYKNQ